MIVMINSISGDFRENEESAVRDVVRQYVY